MDESANPIELTLDNTAKMTPAPQDFTQTGDLTMLQQSYFVGGGIRFYDK
jgi:hypothetical protein